MKDLTRFFYHFFTERGFSENTAEYLNLTIGIVILAVTLFVLDLLLKKVCIAIFKKYASKSRTLFDDYLVKNKTFDYIAHIVPLSLVIWILPMLFVSFPTAEKYLKSLFDIMSILLVIWILRSVLKTCRDYL